jgi:hypothetical protein
MSALNLSRLSGPDAVAALRSYPRRFRTAILPTDDPEVEELAYQVGPDGRSALDHVVTTTNTFVLLGQALRQTLSGSQPTVHGAVTDAGQRQWDTPSGLTIAEGLDRLTEEAGALATAADRIEMSEWDRTASVAGSNGTVTTADIVKEAVRSGADHLRSATADVEAARARRA